MLAGIPVTRASGARPRTRPGRVLADRAYSSRTNRQHLARRGIAATTPIKTSGGEPAHEGLEGGLPPTFEPSAYRQRDTVECGINRLKRHQGLATRYDCEDDLVPPGTGV